MEKKIENTNYTKKEKKAQKYSRTRGNATADDDDERLRKQKKKRNDWQKGKRIIRKEALATKSPLCLLSHCPSWSRRALQALSLSCTGRTGVQKKSRTAASFSLSLLGAIEWPLEELIDKLQILFINAFHSILEHCSC